MIISIKQAIAQKSTPSELRVLANSLERIARDGYYFETEDDGVNIPYANREPAYDRKGLIENAAALRRLAGELHRLQVKVRIAAKELVDNGNKLYAD